ncbi:23406_t:CDS:2 [Gigaspora rosea]|nr:23406_t:CDS:2 [Gigaspora rosea]
MSEYLFNESLISDDIQKELPDGYKLRPLAKDDFNKGVIQCLEQLSVTGEITEENFIERFEKMKIVGGYYIIVIESDEKKVVAVGTLFVEMKFIRGCGKAGHIEDIVNVPFYRKCGLETKDLQMTYYYDKETKNQN